MVTEVGFEPTDFQQLINKYNFIFSRSRNDAGLNQSWVVDLELKDPSNKSPIFRKNYKLDPKMTALL